MIVLIKLPAVFNYYFFFQKDNFALGIKPCVEENIYKHPDTEKIFEAQKKNYEQKRITHRKNI